MDSTGDIIDRAQNPTMGKKKQTLIVMSLAINHLRIFLYKGVYSKLIHDLI